MTLDLQVGLSTADQGALGGDMRPGLFIHHFPSLPIYTDFLTIPNIGYMRDSLSWQMVSAKNLHEFLAAVQALFDTNDARISQPLRAGVQMCISLFDREIESGNTLPEWLRDISNDQDDTASVVNGPFLDYGILEELCYQTGLLFVAAAAEFGFSLNQVRFGVGNEFNLGPTPTNSAGFVGAVEEKVRVDGYACHGVKRASRDLRFVGPEASSAWNHALSMSGGITDSGPGSILETYIKRCRFPPPDLYGGASVPLDGISLHLFSGDPIPEFLPMVRVWLERYDYDPDLVEVLILESSYSVLPAAVAAGEEGAANLAVRCLRHREALVDGWAFALLDGGTITNTATGFSGEQGLTHSVTGGAHNGERVKTTRYLVMDMLALLGPRRVSYTLSQDAKNVGVVAECTADGNTRWVLLARSTFGFATTSTFFSWQMYLQDERFAPMRGVKFRKQPLDLGFVATSSQGVYNAADYVGGTVSLDASVPDDVRAFAVEAKARGVAYRGAGAVAQVVTLDCVDRAAIDSYEVYYIGPESAVNNPRKAYIDTRAAGGGAGAYDAAVQAAIDASTLTVTDSGTGAAFPLSISLGIYSVALVKIVASSATPNPSSAIFSPKEISQDIGLFLDPAVEATTDPVVVSRLRGIPREYTGRQSFREAALAFGASVSWDLNTHQRARLTGTGACAIQTPSHMNNGMDVVLRFIAGSSAAVPAFSTAFRNIPVAARWNLTLGAVNVLSFYCSDTLMICTGMSTTGAP